MFERLRGQFTRKKGSLSEKSSSGPRPTADVIPLGPGISVIMPRSLTAKVPKKLGIGNECYKASIRDLFLRIFNLLPTDLFEQDKTWSEWLNLKDGRVQEPRDLCALVKSDLALAFRARAIVILLLPDLKFSPFEWKDDSRIEDWNYLFLGDRIEVVTLPDQLQHFIGELVCLNVDAVLTTEFNEKLLSTIFDYNNYIIQLLAILPESDPMADELFKRFPMNDPIGFSGMEDASGYNPFKRLLRSGIPEKWKLLADRQMQEIVRSEQEGHTIPRYEWEVALSCYMSIIQLGLYGDNFPYRKELFATQIAFVLTLPNVTKHSLIDSYKLYDVLRMLAGDENKQLRHSVARYAVLDTRKVEYGSFMVYSDDTRQAAQAILDEFGSEDEELRSRLESLVAHADERAREEASQTVAKEEQVDAVLSKMR